MLVVTRKPSCGQCGSYDWLLSILAVSSALGGALKSKVIPFPKYRCLSAEFNNETDALPMRVHLSAMNQNCS